MPRQIIHLHPASPPKPSEGEACNGCGVCCALETCPVARLLFFKIDGPCPALTWSTDENRYRCGLLQNPERHLHGLPSAWTPAAQRLLARWIASGKGCDCSAEVDDDSCT